MTLTPLVPVLLRLQPFFLVHIELARRANVILFKIKLGEINMAIGPPRARAPRFRSPEEAMSAQVLNITVPLFTHLSAVAGMSSARTSGHLGKVCSQ
jgi:hypothetical protein